MIALQTWRQWSCFNVICDFKKRPEVYWIYRYTQSCTIVLQRLLIKWIQLKSASQYPLTKPVVLVLALHTTRDAIPSPVMVDNSRYCKVCLTEKYLVALLGGWRGRIKRGRGQGVRRLDRTVYNFCFVAHYTHCQLFIRKQPLFLQITFCAQLHVQL